jgi:FkbM family methyltransferase
MGTQSTIAGIPVYEISPADARVRRANMTVYPLCAEKPKIIRKLRKRYCQLMELFGFRSVLVRSSGAFFLVDRSDWIADRIAIDGIWEPDRINHLAAVARHYAFDRFIDIGANIGFYAILFAAHRMAPAVMAFEPLPRNYQTLVKNVAWNRLSRTVQPLRFALGNENAMITIAEGDSGMRSNGTIGESQIAEAGEQHVVEQIRFDDRLSIHSQSLLLKVDIERAELGALQGMTRTLRENLCYLQIEAFPDRFESVRALLADCGYAHVGAMGDDHYFTNIDPRALTGKFAMTSMRPAAPLPPACVPAAPPLPPTPTV